MADALIVAVGFFVGVCLAAIRMESTGGFPMLPKSKIQRLFDDDVDRDHRS